MATALTNTGDTSASSLGTQGGSSSSSLSNWAAPYVTQMLGQTQALGATPYQVYQGPQTAGPSALQSNVFSGLGSLSFPSNLGQSFSSQGAYKPPQFGASTAMPSGATATTLQTDAAKQAYSRMQDLISGGNEAGAKDFYNTKQREQGFSDADFASISGSPYNAQQIGAWKSPTGAAGATTSGAMQAPQQQNIAQQYMNPYLQSVLNPQLQDMQRQAQIAQQSRNAQQAQAGAFGSRGDVANAAAQSDLMRELNKTVGTGYSNAYDRGLQQFNTEQGQAAGLTNLMAQQGAVQQGMEQQGVTADYKEFLAQRDYPQEMLKFQQSMLQGLPISTVTNTAAQPSALGQATQTIGGLTALYELYNKLTK